MQEKDALRNQYTIERWGQRHQHRSYVDTQWEQMERTIKLALNSKPFFLPFVGPSHRMPFIFATSYSRLSLLPFSFDEITFVSSPSSNSGSIFVSEYLSHNLFHSLIRLRKSSAASLRTWKEHKGITILQ